MILLPTILHLFIATCYVPFFVGLRDSKTIGTFNHSHAEPAGRSIPRLTAREKLALPIATAKTLDWARNSDADREKPKHLILLNPVDAYELRAPKPLGNRSIPPTKSSLRVMPRPDHY
jgi:hypothetical protein